MGSRRVLNQDDIMAEAGRVPSHGKWSKEKPGAGGQATGTSAPRGTARAQELWVTANRECCKWSPYRSNQKVSK